MTVGHLQIQSTPPSHRATPTRSVLSVTARIITSSRRLGVTRTIYFVDCRKRGSGRFRRGRCALERCARVRLCSCSCARVVATQITARRSKAPTDASRADTVHTWEYTSPSRPPSSSVTPRRIARSAASRRGPPTGPPPPPCASLSPLPPGAGGLDHSR